MGLRSLILGNSEQRLAATISPSIDLVSPWKYVLPRYPDTVYTELVKQAYHKSELIYACVQEVATSVAEVIFKVQTEVNGVEFDVPDHPVQELLENPNPEMTSSEWWECILSLEQIAGDMYVWKERHPVTGQPVALWPLRPDWVRPVFSHSQVVSGYNYWPGGFGEGIPIPVDDMIHFIHAVDPLDVYGQGMSPVRVCMRNTALDNNITDYMKAFFDNAAVPFGIIKVKQRIQNRRIANAIRRRWTENFSGNRGWHAPAILDEDAEYQALGFNLEQLKVESLRNVPETRICMAFGIPPILVGAEVGLQRSTYSNYREARASFWDETLSPLFKKYAERLQKNLMPEFADPETFEIVADTSQVRALQENETQKWTRATSALNAGGITINMFLAEIGRPLIGPEGDVLLRRSTIVAVPVSTKVQGARSASYTSLVLRRAGLIHLMSPRDRKTYQLEEPDETAVS